MQHSMPTMQELVEYQVNPQSRMAKEIDANEMQEKLDHIDNLVRRYATWDSIMLDILNDDGQPNRNGTTVEDCLDMKSGIMSEIKSFLI